MVLNSGRPKPGSSWLRPSPVKPRCHRSIDWFRPAVGHGSMRELQAFGDADVRNVRNVRDHDVNWYEMIYDIWLYVYDKWYIYRYIHMRDGWRMVSIQASLKVSICVMNIQVSSQLGELSGRCGTHAHSFTCVTHCVTFKCSSGECNVKTLSQGGQCCTLNSSVFVKYCEIKRHLFAWKAPVRVRKSVACGASD